MSDGLRVAVVGATGLVGREILALLEERRFPVAELVAFASEGSSGDSISFADGDVAVHEVPSSWPRFDLAFLCATAEVSRRAAGALAAGGAVVIDVTAAHRDAKEATLALPGEGLDPKTSIVSIPHPSTTLLVSLLRPLVSHLRIRRVVATALLSISSLGRDALDRLGTESAELLNGQTPDEERQVAFDGGPEPRDGDRFLAAEVRRDASRLLGVDLALSFSAVRVPLFFGQGLSLAIEAEEPIDVAEAESWLRAAPSLILDPDATATTIREAAGGEAVHVAMIRVDPTDRRWLQLWATADNVRQGVALTAVSVAETMVRYRGAH